MLACSIIPLQLAASALFRHRLIRRPSASEVREVRRASIIDRDLAALPLLAVGGEQLQQVRHRHLGAVAIGEPGKAIGAVPRAAGARDSDRDIGVARQPHMRTYSEQKRGVDARVASRDDGQLVPNMAELFLVGDDRLPQLVRLILKSGEDVGAGMITQR